MCAHIAHLLLVCDSLLRSGVSAYLATRFTTCFAYNAGLLRVLVITILFLGRGVFDAGGRDLHAEWNESMRARTLAGQGTTTCSTSALTRSAY